MHVMYITLVSTCVYTHNRGLQATKAMHDLKLSIYISRIQNVISVCINSIMFITYLHTTGIFHLANSYTYLKHKYCPSVLTTTQRNFLTVENFNESDKLLPIKGLVNILPVKCQNFLLLKNYAVQLAMSCMYFLKLNQLQLLLYKLASQLATQTREA